MPGIHPVLQATIVLGIEQAHLHPKRLSVEIQFAAFFSKLLG